MLGTNDFDRLQETLHCLDTTYDGNGDMPVCTPSLDGLVLVLGAGDEKQLEGQT